VRGPAVAQLEAAFLDSWNAMGAALDAFPEVAAHLQPAGTVAMRVIATQPPSASLYRLDQLIASMARTSLWLCDAYFVGIAPYVQALVAAARDGVDVRMLVPGNSDIPIVSGLSRGGYRPLLQAGIRVFEWNGSMLHAKTAVADRQWARVGSSNLNVSSWLGNREIDVAIEDAHFSARLAAQYERDLENATEIVLAPRRYRRSEPTLASDSPRSKTGRGRGGSGRAAAGALRMANTVGAALANHRVLGDVPMGPLLTAIVLLLALATISFLRPVWIGWPVGVMAVWIAVNVSVRIWRLYRRRRDASP
jgi:cardiolipin synthase